MAIDIIQSIKEAESQAEQIRKQSLEEARNIVAQAEQQAKKLIDQSIEESEKKSRDILIEAEKSANMHIEEHKNQVSLECSKIKQNAREKLDKAVEIIMERIVKFHGDS